MKKLIKISIILIITFFILYPATWVAATKGMMGDMEFGYYKGLHIANHAIEKSGCVESITPTILHRDVTLEEFGLTAHTKSGKLVHLWFDASQMDVNQVCYYPAGIRVNGQLYTIEFLNELLKEKNIRIRNLKDILCNIDALEQLFNANSSNDSIPKIAYTDSFAYLQIDILDKE